MGSLPIRSTILKCIAEVGSVRQGDPIAYVVNVFIYDFIHCAEQSNCLKQADEYSGSLFGDVGKLVTPVDCKSAARKALLVRLQSSPPNLSRVRETVTQESHKL